MLIEEGFTLQKYEELFFDTMEEEELEEWTDRLPDHPKLPAKSIKSKKGNRVSISPSDASSSEDDEEEYELIGGGRSRGKCVESVVYLVRRSNFYLVLHLHHVDYYITHHKQMSLY